MHGLWVHSLGLQIQGRRFIGFFGVFVFPIEGRGSSSLEV